MKRDHAAIELRDLQKEIRGINPKLSTYAKLKKREKELLEILGDQVMDTKSSTFSRVLSGADLALNKKLFKKEKKKEKEGIIRCNFKEGCMQIALFGSTNQELNGKCKRHRKAINRRKAHEQREKKRLKKEIRIFLNQTTKS